MVQEDVSVTYRDLESSDFARMGSLVRAFGDDSDMLNIFKTSIDMDNFKKTTESLFELGMLNGVVAESEGIIAGAFLYIITPNLFSGDKTAAEAMWYTHRRYRDSAMGGRLYLKAEKQILESDCKLMMMTHLETSMPEELKSFYEKRGFTHIESNYQKRL